jgi:integrase
MARTQKEIQALKPTEKRQHLGCGDGLNIIIEPIQKGGGKSFEGRYSVKVDGRRKQIPVRIGVFGMKPGQYTLRMALEKWNEIKFWAKKENQDPRRFGKEQPLTQQVTLKQAIDSFLLAKTRLKEHTIRNYKLQLMNQVLSTIDGATILEKLEWDNGGRQIVMDIKKNIEKRGSNNQAERVQKLLCQCFDHAIDKGWLRRGQNPAVKVSKDQGLSEERHHPTIDWKDVAKLLDDINTNRCSSHAIVVLSVKLMLLTFLRAGALVRLKWDWIDFDQKIIVIPGSTPGLKRTFATQQYCHHIPFSSEIESILREAQNLRFSDDFVFGAYRMGKYPHLQPEAPNNFLKNLGYKDVLTAHGWRSVALTVGQEQLNFKADIIQRQMGHLIGDKVRKAYDNSLMLEQRRDFLEKWSKLLVDKGLKL